ncbi:MAG: PTS lactose/cellobiose transporter subunit IIA [Erysipelotrichaceae bacterium]|jgi:PTS system cellobiose-specific IIA component|nr:PTS lactose/cellobiose transporter subunit IIA [Erysipelotrichaceae bacterium]
MNDNQQKAFQIISSAGSARSFFINAMDVYEDHPEEADKLLEEGHKQFHEAHEIHARMIQSYAQGEDVKMDLLMVHAEDQLMAAEQFSIICEKYMHLSDKIKDS